MSRDTTDIANELLAENAVLKGQLAQRDAQIARMEVELSGADERSKMIFEAKDHWADRARKAEAQIAALENDEVRQRLENAEHQLHMKDLAIYNIRASRRAQFHKRRAVEVQNSELRVQIAALTAENVALKDFTLKARDAVENWNSWADEEDKILNEPETPATDAAANALRAEGVEWFATALAHEVMKSGEDYDSWKSAASNAAMDYANQLREGK